MLTHLINWVRDLVEQKALRDEILNAIEQAKGEIMSQLTDAVQQLSVSITAAKDRILADVAALEAKANLDSNPEVADAVAKIRASVSDLDAIDPVASIPTDQPPVDTPPTDTPPPADVPPTDVPVDQPPTDQPPVTDVPVDPNA